MALDWLIAKISGYIKDSLTGQGNMSELIEVIQRQAESSNELSTILANGLIKANDNLTGLNEKLTESLPRLIELSRPYLRETLTPVGKSCSQIVQFPDTPFSVTVTEAEAMAIRSDEDLVVGKAGDYEITRIHSLNLDTGACRIEVSEVRGLVTGKIDDIELTQPGNPYSTALNNHSALAVRARPVYRDDQLYRLFITESR